MTINSLELPLATVKHILMGVTPRVLTATFEHPHTTDHMLLPGWSSVLHHHGGVIRAMRESKKLLVEPGCRRILERWLMDGEG